MAIDTLNKRKSAINVRWIGRNYPEPDGSLANDLDRQHMAGVYAGFTPQGGIGMASNIRSSIINYMLPWNLPPAPDGDTANRADRLDIAWLYRGIIPIGGTTNTGTGSTPQADPGELGPGIIRFTSSSSAEGRTIINPPLRGQTGTYWRPSIDNAGIVSITDNAAVSEGEAFAAFLDDDGVMWPWEVDACSQAEVSTLLLLRSAAHRVSVRCTFSTGRDTALPFRIYSIRPYLRIRNEDVPFAYEANAEARIARPSIRVKKTGGPFVIHTINCRLKPLKNQVRG